MLKLITEQVDIYQMPKADCTLLDKGGEIVIGDLHGNAIKLLFMLFKHGVASGLDTTDYQVLVAIYQMPPKALERSDLEIFNAILAKIRFNSALGIRLLGDELADRGSNDYFTLKLLEQLHTHGVPFEIIASNHALEFIQAYETKKEFKPSVLHYEHARSLVHLNTLITNNLVTYDEISLIIKTVYKPNIKAVAYSVDKEKSEISIYSHAGVGLNTIKALAEQLELPYADASLEQLTESIDAINTIFQSHVTNNTVHTLYSKSDILLAYMGKKITHLPFVFLLWNREYKDIERPKVQFSYTINYVHGHDSNEGNHNNIFNLDNLLGKFEGLNKGDYTVVYSSSSQMPYVKPFSSAELRFNSALEAIRQKACDLKSQGHVNAAITALTFYKTVGNAFDTLRKTKQTKHFKLTFLQAMEIARPELERHRGCKEILVNLARFQAGFESVDNTSNNYAQKDGLLFFRTDSAEKMDKLEDSFEGLIEYYEGVLI